VFRLILVATGAVSGYEVGRSINPNAPYPVLGLILGALIGYVIGGIVGRWISRREEAAVAPFARIPPGEFFAGSLTGLVALLLAGALCIPLVAVWHDPIVYPLVALVVWVFAWGGFLVGAAKGRQIVAAAGLTRILAPPTEPPPGYALLVDTSALMDRSLLVLGRSGLLVGGLVIPRFVVDQVQSLGAGPDPVTSRRARRALESLEALRELGVSVHVAENELPEIDDLNERLLEICRRLGLRFATCSRALYERAEQRGLRVTDLRRIAGELTPDFPPGEKLVVDLVRPGNQARQAVGYLPDGDMVVVNDAAHWIGREDVVVEVQSTRITSQGLLVFARLADGQQPRPETDYDLYGYDEPMRPRLLESGDSGSSSGSSSTSGSGTGSSSGSGTGSGDGPRKAASQFRRR
jgi:uncharacterized protein YacL